MKTISLSKYGPTITNDSVAAEIFSLILLEGVENNVVQIDLEGIITMTTKCAKAIFGHLYRELGVSKYYQNVILINYTSTLEMIIDEAIDSCANEDD